MVSQGSDRTQYLPVRSPLPSTSAYVIEYHKTTELKQPENITYHPPTQPSYFVVKIRNTSLQGFHNMPQNDTQHDKGLTAEGKPRKRRQGGGRPAKHGEATRSIRVPLSVETEVISAIPELRAILDHWEQDCISNPESARHYYLKKALDEIRALGF